MPVPGVGGEYAHSGREADRAAARVIPPAGSPASIRRDVGEVCGDLASLRDHRVGPEPARSVGGANEWPREDAEEADPLGLLLELDELVRLHPAGDRKMTRRGTQILRDRDDVAPGFVEVLERLDHLGGLFAHAEDQVRLRDEARFMSLRDDVQGTFVAE